MDHFSLIENRQVLDLGLPENMGPSHLAFSQGFQQIPRSVHRRFSAVYGMPPPGYLFACHALPGTCFLAYIYIYI